ncbi:MAG: response regulator [Deltaproteobacteria bacterium]|nr:response regulator [Deltaproteobacteria bacterium]
MAQKLLPQTILLVDDDSQIRRLGRELLEHLGFRVATAADGPQALEVFHRLGKVDLVILDYHLPGMSGHLLLQKLKGLDAGVRVLMASGFLSIREATRLRESGAQGIICKPFRLMELKPLLQDVMGNVCGD